MSGVLKSVGKVFKKVVKTVVKVAPYALAIGAVVLTGGAALGALPAVGTMVTGVLGSGALATAVTGAISGAGISGAIGLATGGLKGLKKGALIGGLTGGVAGALGAGLNVGKGTLAAAMPGASGASGALPAVNGMGSAQASGSLMTGVGAEPAQLALTGPAPAIGASLPAAAGGGSLMSGVGAVPAPLPLSAPAAIGPVAATVPAAPAGAGGLASSLIGLAKSPTVIGSVVSDIGQGMTAGAQSKDQRRREQQLADSYAIGAVPAFGPGAAPQYYYDSAAKRLLLGAA